MEPEILGGNAAGHARVHGNVGVRAADWTLIQPTRLRSSTTHRVGAVLGVETGRNRWGTGGS